jgi:flagellum-specific ATP synthase
VRSHASFAATSVAEYFRDTGRAVVLTMDSVTRFAMARRELGLAIGEPPTARGYTPSAFALLPRLLERGGMSESGGSITALYTVLIEADDLNDPVADTIRAIVDGNIVLSRDLANEGHFPAIDLLQSNSRLMPQLVSAKEVEEASGLTSMLSRYQSARDMVEVGAYRAGSHPELDRVIERLPVINSFLRQTPDQHVTRNEARVQLAGLVA